MTGRWIVCVCGGGGSREQVLLKETHFLGLLELAKLKMLLLLLLLYVKKKAVGLVNFFPCFRIRAILFLKRIRNKGHTSLYLSFLVQILAIVLQKSSGVQLSLSKARLAS